MNVRAEMCEMSREQFERLCIVRRECYRCENKWNGTAVLVRAWFQSAGSCTGLWCKWCLKMVS